MVRRERFVAKIDSRDDRRGLSYPDRTNMPDDGVMVSATAVFAIVVALRCRLRRVVR